VGRLHLIQGPPERAPGTDGRPEAAAAAEENPGLSQRLASVKDPALRRALEGLGRAVLGRHRDAPGR
jgi:hypothetical protein